MTEHAVVIVRGGPTGDCAATRSGSHSLSRMGGWGAGETLRHSLENANGRKQMGSYVLNLQQVDQAGAARARPATPHLTVG